MIPRDPLKPKLKNASPRSQLVLMGGDSSSVQDPRESREEPMYQSILVPLDGSAFAEAALPVAVAIARRSGAVLHLARVDMAAAAPLQYARGSVLAGGSGVGPAVGEEAERPALDYLDATASGLVEDGIHTAIRLLDGPFLGSLIGYAESIDADLVVIATHARGPLARVWTGSVARGLVRQCHRPCLLVRPGGGDVTPDAEQLFRHVLIPLDGSHASEQVVSHAVSLGALGAARYTLLHVLSPATLVGYAGSPGVSLNWPDLQERQAEATLERTAAQLRLRSIDVAKAVIRSAHTARAIRKYAATHDVDLVALATYGSGLSRMALGNVADRVARESPVPVLLYRPAS